MEEGTRDAGEVEEDTQGKIADNVGKYLSADALISPMFVITLTESLLYCNFLTYFTPVSVLNLELQESYFIKQSRAI